MNEVMISSFFEELIKIAQDAAPVADPRAQEMQDLQAEDPERSKAISNEVLKQKLKNTAAIMGGAALGEGAALLTNMGLNRAAQHYGKSLPKWAPYAAHGLLVPAMGFGSALAYQAMRDKDRQLLEEARARGEQVQ